MTLLIVDHEKCKKDGICALDCPMSIINVDQEKGPTINPPSEDSCLRCGHCVAICPHEALSHNDVPIQDCVPIKKDLRINADQAVQFLRSRRSIRVFKDKPVEKADMQKLIEIGRYAPTGSNSQLVEWVVFTDPDKIHDIAERVIQWIKGVMENDQLPSYAPYMPIVAAAWDFGYDAVLRHAPGLIIAHAPKEAGNGMVDVTLALAYLELAATTQGMGTCWAGMLFGAMRSQPSIKTALGLSEDTTYFYPMMIGYPKTRYFRLPERKPPNIVWK